MYNKLFTIPAVAVVVVVGCAQAQTPAQAAEPYGEWSCEVHDFTLTPERYGDEDILETHRDGNQYAFLLKGGYRFSMLDVSDNAATWHSLETGDTFECMRIG